ncbi:hypothetical protein [Herbidospora mongoliensis]|uniref:hypothetical protein n=1 Tax=Herbidospora mongoliensis TaxID=688067 RepID=UPI00082A0693|nr:hypothetical protein [Herbidospora mongoliensis]
MSAFNGVVEQVANYSAIPLSLLGFALTLWQLMKARRAAEAARDAALQAQGAIRKNSVLMLIPQLLRTEEELDRAVRDSSVELTMVWLTSWKSQASQLRGFLELASLQNNDVMKALQSSVAKATIVRLDLTQQAKGINLVLATRAARESISLVTVELSALAAVQATQIGERHV